MCKHTYVLMVALSLPMLAWGCRGTAQGFAHIPESIGNYRNLSLVYTLPASRFVDWDGLMHPEAMENGGHGTSVGYSGWPQRLTAAKTRPTFARVLVEYDLLSDNDHGIATVEMNWKPMVDSHTARDPYLTKSIVVRIPKQMVDDVLEDEYIARRNPLKDEKGRAVTQLCVNKDGEITNTKLLITHNLVELARQAWRTGHASNRRDAGSDRDHGTNQITRLPPVN